LWGLKSPISQKIAATVRYLPFLAEDGKSRINLYFLVYELTIDDIVAENSWVMGEKTPTTSQGVQIMGQIFTTNLPIPSKLDLCS
jgi:hypothetical protein